MFATSLSRFGRSAAFASPPQYLFIILAQRYDNILPEADKNIYRVLIQSDLARPPKYITNLNNPVLR